MSLDLVPLAQLPSRYGIARSNLYNRIKDLKIESVKHGRKAFVTAAHLELLDNLHAHLERGGTTLGFQQLLKKRGHQLTHVSSFNSPLAYPQDLSYGEPTIALNPTALVGAIETVVRRIVPQYTQPASNLSYLKDLEEAYQSGWLLSTSEVSDLLGLSPRTISNYGRKFTDAGFSFTRAGTRKGGEIAWSIDKQSSWTEEDNSTKAVEAAFDDIFDS